MQTSRARGQFCVMTAVQSATYRVYEFAEVAHGSCNFCTDGVGWGGGAFGWGLRGLTLKDIDFVQCQTSMF